MSETTAAATELAMAGAAPPAPGWSIDRRVPLALIIAGVLQFGLGCGAVAVLYSNVNTQGQRISAIEASRAERHESELKTIQTMQIDIARIFERVDSILALQRREATKTP